MKRAPYWTLVALAALLTLPFGWAAGLMGAAVLGRVAWAVARGSGVVGSGQGGSTPGANPVAVALGVTPRGRTVGLSDSQLSTHGLIVGASGAGKSTTLLTILGQQIARGRPVVVLDLKGSPTFASGLEQAARSAGRSLTTWTPDGASHWNPLAQGNATELKDKLISTERFTEPHYARAAERYVQTVLQVLLADGRRPQLDQVVELMEPRRLAALGRRLPSAMSERVQDYLDGMSADQLSAVRGLGTRLAVLSESQAGPFLTPSVTGRDIDLGSALDGGDVVLFSLNSSRYGKLAAQLGTLAIQDLVSVAGQRLEDAGRGPGALVAVDEFSALGADHVLALLARGRESGISVLVATQELADLERAGRGFRDQVLGLTATKIAHRQDVPGSALLIAQMAGTEQVWEQTLQMRGLLSAGGGSRGSRRLVEHYQVHPNEIKILAPGQAVVLTKAPVAGVTRLQVTPPALQGLGSSPARPSAPGAQTWPAAAPASAAAQRGLPAGRDSTRDRAGAGPDPPRPRPDPGRGGQSRAAGR